jgi:hypothetical protein
MPLLEKGRYDMLNMTAPIRILSSEDAKSINI